MNLTLRSTMSRDAQEVIFNSGSYDDVLDFATAIRTLCEDAKEATFRITEVEAIEGEDPCDTSSLEWALEKLSQDRDLMARPDQIAAALVLFAEADEYGKQIMIAIYYAQRVANKGGNVGKFIDELNVRANSADYRVCFDEDESTAFKEFGKEEGEGDCPEGIAGYVDWESYGRHNCDGSGQDWDGDTYVWKEWF